MVMSATPVGLANPPINPNTPIDTTESREERGWTEFFIWSLIVFFIMISEIVQYNVQNKKNCPQYDINSFLSSAV